MRAIFGVHLTATQTLQVNAAPNYSGATMYKGVPDDGSVSWSTVSAGTEGWEVEVGAGDYIFRVEDAATDDTCSIVCTTDDFTIVTIDSSTPPILKYGTVEQDKATETHNPKDPWPPPPPPPGSELPSGSYDWFTDNLLPYSGSLSRGAA